MKIDGVSFDLGKQVEKADRSESLNTSLQIPDIDSSNIDVDLEKMIKDGIQAINEPQAQLNGKINNFLQGKEELHNVMIASEQAKFSMNFTVKVRDKIIDAYQTIMRMQV
jgi:flagellar hook-basal body complex protein FliE